VTFAEFTKSPATRQRYWSRNMAAWPVFSAVQPNRTHVGIAAMEAAGRLRHVITQARPLPPPSAAPSR
jgi:NAD-dependent SIR2 family protein deacetylase